MRYIALLEFQPGLTANIMPPSSYMERTNGTLVQENCRTVIDADGFMVSDQPLAPGDRKVLLLGGSSVENLYIRDDQRILSVIERQLDARGLTTKVYNAGISNAHLLHLFNILVNKGLGLRPDCVVWYPTSGTDVLANEVERGFWNRADALSPIRKAGRDLKMELDCPLVNRNGFDDERRLLRTMYDVCHRFGIRLLVATWPVYGTYDEFAARIEPDRAGFEAGDVQMRALNDVIREVCTEMQGDLVDLEAVLVGRHRPDYFYDRNHPNSAGCELIATATSQVIAAVLAPPATT